MDGYAAIRQIRKPEQQLGVPPVPIGLTASSLREEVRECLASGCSFHVSKPISNAALLDAVSRATATPRVEATVGQS
jgi:CheY-like chemotaxis protein